MAGLLCQIVIVLTLSASLTGCATVMNIACGPRQVYGGIQVDAQVIAHASQALVTGQPVALKGALLESTGTALVLGAAVADLSLSAIADTVTLPWTVTWWGLDRQVAKDYEERDPDAKSKREYRRQWLEQEGAKPDRTSDPSATN
jgi:uncharacterized protein YceK